MIMSYTTMLYLFDIYVGLEILVIIATVLTVIISIALCLAKNLSDTEYTSSCVEKFNYKYGQRIRVACLVLISINVFAPSSDTVGKMIMVSVIKDVVSDERAVGIISKVLEHIDK